MDILEILGRIGFDWRVFVFNLFNFLVIALLVRRFFFKKIMETIAERQRLINEGLQNAEMAKAELASSQRKGEEIIQQAKSEGNTLVKDSVTRAEAAALQIHSEAEAKAVQTHEKAKQQAVQERGQMFSDFKKEAADLVVLATEKLLNKKSSSKAQTEDVESLIQSMELKKTV